MPEYTFDIAKPPTEAEKALAERPALLERLRLAEAVADGWIALCDAPDDDNLRADREFEAALAAYRVTRPK